MKFKIINSIFYWIIDYQIQIQMCSTFIVSGCLFWWTVYKIDSMQALMEEVTKNVNILFAYALKQCKLMR